MLKMMDLLRISYLQDKKCPLIKRILIKAVNHKLEADKNSLVAELGSLKARKRLEETRDKASAHKSLKNKSVL